MITVSTTTLDLTISGETIAYEGAGKNNSIKSSNDNLVFIKKVKQSFIINVAIASNALATFK